MDNIATAPAATAVHTSASPTAVLAIIVGSYLMIVIDISIVITGLPKIQAELQFTHAGLSWVQNAYTLAFGGLLMLGARAGDILGRRRMFVYGLALFTLASLAIGIAQSPAWLLSARAVQGVGAAILAPSTLALLSTHFAEGPERTRALAYYAAAAGVGASLGLVLGGLVADLISWRVAFFINLPIGIALILGARRCIAETAQRPGQFDLVGAFTSTLGMTALVYGIVRSAESGWGDALTIASLAIGVVLLAAFVFNEAHAHQPILPLRLFASRERSGAYAARMLFFGGMVGMAWLAQVSVDTPYLTGVALPMILIGIGQGGVLGPLTVSAVAGVAGEDAGAASGLVNVAHQLGGSLGLGVLVVVFAASGFAHLDAPALLAHRIAATFGAGTVMLSIALALVPIFIVARPSAPISTRRA